MGKSLCVRGLLIALLGLGMVPAVALAQSGIAGVVKDDSGGVMPGVTVEAASPALIEKVRTAVTDERGQYRIVDLRPGTYTMTFTLEGFSVVKREGITLPADFTATINADLKVGSLQETVLVTAEAPVVDVQNAVAQQVLPQKLLDAVPTGGRNIQSVGATLVGVQQSAPDVGGSAGMQQTYMSAHGADPRDATVMVDGIKLNGIEGNGAIQQYFNEGMFAEMSYQTGGLGAETAYGGVRVNMVPKDGGNQVHGDTFFSYTNHNLQANPLPPDIVERGLKSADAMDSMHDLNVSAGGPLKVNKVWFFGSFRYWGVNQQVANGFYPLAGTPQVNSFTPDLSRGVIDDNLIKSFMARVTWQATQKNKVSFYLDRIIKFRGHETQTPSGTSVQVRSEDTYGVRTPKQYHMDEFKWTSTLTSKLLLQVGLGTNNESYSTVEPVEHLRNCIAAGTCVPRAKVDIDTLNFWGAPPGPYYERMPIRDTLMASLAYVTGTHALKVGMELGHGLNFYSQNYLQPGINFVERYKSGVPNSVIIYNTPIIGKDRLKADLGLYVQDTWTMKKLTLTPGLRVDYWKTGYDEEGIPLDQQQLMLLEGYPQRGLYPARDMPTWTNISPRFGVAYDIFGNGKTAIKGGVNKYSIAYSTTTYPQTVNPMVQSQSETRTWTDSNGNLQYDPGVDALSASTNKLFGQVWRDLDPDIKRPFNIEYSASLQHELRPGVSVSVGYYRRQYYNSIYSYNTVLKDNPAAFTATTITNPCATGVRDCGGVAPQTLTVYALNPALRGAGSIVDTNSANNTRVYNGFEATFMARLGKGQLFGGMNTQKQVSNNCEGLDTGSNFSYASDPNNVTNFCDQNQYGIPFQTQLKVGGTYPIAYGFVAGFTFQSYPGTRDYGSGSTATNWLTVTSPNSATVGLPSAQQESNTIELIQPGSKFLNRYNQLDFRLARKFTLRGGIGLDLQVDLFNSLNNHVVTAQTTSYGSNLDRPTKILQSRMVSFGAQLHF